jgi:hypothetical protein
MGDARILRRELKDDDISRAALEETAHFLGQIAQEMLAGIAPQSEQPGMTLAELGKRPEPAVEEAAPEDNSQAAALLARLGA